MKSARVSLRRRLLLTVIATALVVGALTVFATLRFLQRESNELLDAQLARSARVLERTLRAVPIEAGMVIPLPDWPEGNEVDEAQPFGHLYEYHVAFQVLDGAGKVIARSHNAPENAMANPRPGYSENKVAGRRWHIFSVNRGELDGWVVVGEDERARQELRWEFSATTLLTILGGFAVVSLIVLWQTERTLLPVRRLASRLDKRLSTNFAPVSDQNLPAEIIPLVDALNSHLSRLDAAFRREQEFTANAAHELRTPLAAIRVHAENAVAATNEQDRIESLNRLRQGIARATRMVEQLLALARIEAETLTLDFESIDSRELLDKSASVYRDLAARRGIRLALDCERAPAVNGKASILSIALDNLLRNAVEHSPADGTIILRCRHRDHRVIFEVLDQGRGIEEHERTVLLSRHARGNSENENGHGLGLDIANLIVGLHGGRLELSGRGEQNGLCARIVLPAAVDS